MADLQRCFDEVVCQDAVPYKNRSLLWRSEGSSCVVAIDPVSGGVAILPQLSSEVFLNCTGQSDLRSIERSIEERHGDLRPHEIEGILKELFRRGYLEVRTASGTEVSAIQLASRIAKKYHRK